MGSRSPRQNRHLQTILVGLASALLIAVPRNAAAQTITLFGNHPREAVMLTSPPPAALQLNIRVNFALRDRLGLDKLLSELQTPGSPLYHHWLSPAEFDARFGRTPAEVKAVSEWLAGRGFRIAFASGRKIEATSTVAQAEKAFSTTISGSQDSTLFANQTDPTIPGRFAAVIGSINGLDNLGHWIPLGIPASARTNHLLRIMSRGVASADATEPKPSFKSGFSQAFGPQDLYTFYDETSLLNAGINGGRDTNAPPDTPVECGIAFIEASNYLDTAVALFDTTFSLPAPTIANSVQPASATKRL